MCIRDRTNKGVEFTLNTHNIQTRDFTWTSGLTFSINHNEVTKLYSESVSYTHLDVYKRQEWNRAMSANQNKHAMVPHSRYIAYSPYGLSLIHIYSSPQQEYLRT